MSYKGRISTSGTSEAIRLEKSLFKQHPEFRRQAEVRAHVIGPGTMLISLVDTTNECSEEDPVILAFLSFLEKDLVEHPEQVNPVTGDQVARARDLTAHVTVSDNELE
jgi:antitoxin PrlF